MADLPVWLQALINPQWQGGGVASANPYSMDPSNPAVSQGLLGDLLPRPMGGILTPPKPVPVDSAMDYAADPNTPIRNVATTSQERNFQATAPDSTNVVGTPASGTTEASSPGFDWKNAVGKVSDLIGGIYGGGGPGDALITAGLGFMGKTDVANAVSNSQLNSAKLQAFKAQVAAQQTGANATLNYLMRQGMKPEDAKAAIQAHLGGDSTLLNSFLKQNDQSTKYNFYQDPVTGAIRAVDKYTPVAEPDPANPGQMRGGVVEVAGPTKGNIPLTDPQQRLQYGISPDDRAPYSLNTGTNKVEAVGGGGTKIYNAPEESYTAGLTKALTATHANLAGGVEASQGRARDIAAMQGALARIQANGGTTGIGAEEKAKLQSALNTGWNTIGGSGQPFSVDDAQLLSKFNRQLAGGQAKDTAGARVTNFEMKNFLESNAGLALDPNANKRLLGIQSQIEDRNINVGQQIRQLTADALQNGRQVNPAEVEKLIRGYDATHHIADPITGHDLTKSVKLMDLQDAPASGDSTGKSGSKKAPMWSYGQ